MGNGKFKIQIIRNKFNKNKLKNKESKDEKNIIFDYVGSDGKYFCGK